MKTPSDHDHEVTRQWKRPPVVVVRLILRSTLWIRGGAVAA